MKNIDKSRFAMKNTNKIQKVYLFDGLVKCISSAIIDYKLCQPLITPSPL
jgi:hypothetical protein